MGPADSRPLSRDGRYSGYPSGRRAFIYRTITCSGPSFQTCSISRSAPNWGPTTPEGRVPPVWADPLSLAATFGVEVSFFSSGYYDVSVRRVRFRESRDQRVFNHFPELFAVCHARVPVGA